MLHPCQGISVPSVNVTPLSRYIYIYSIFHIHLRHLSLLTENFILI